jgi:hypothetical protein
LTTIKVCNSHSAIDPIYKPFCLFLSRSEIGVLLTGVGLLFLLFGMMLFFDRALLAIGDVRVSLFLF